MDGVPDRWYVSPYRISSYSVVFDCVSSTASTAWIPIKASLSARNQGLWLHSLTGVADAEFSSSRSFLLMARHHHYSISLSLSLSFSSRSSDKDCKIGNSRAFFLLCLPPSGCLGSFTEMCLLPLLAILVYCQCNASSNSGGWLISVGLSQTHRVCPNLY